MAQVRIDLQRDIDAILDYLLDAWRELPQAERNIGTWDLIEQIDYVEEWSPKIDSLGRLESYAADGLLDDQQRARYAELQRLVGEHGPILERLRRS